MIEYKRGGRWHLLNLFQLSGSVFPAASIQALPSAAISLVLKWYDVVPESSVMENSELWGGFSLLVGFLIIFRTRKAYDRFWDGSTATHQMRAEWIDAASALVAFTRHSTASQELITQFKHTIVRLFSLLHAMALGAIEECKDDDGSLMAYDLELIDPFGLDKQSWSTLSRCTARKADLICSWLLTAITVNIKTGVLSIPGPLLTRVFNELASGMVALEEAQKIAETPFPFPYAQTCDALLIIHLIVSPVIAAHWSSNVWAAAIFGFVQVFVLWSLNSISVEIEHPFGDDANDLETSRMQYELNLCLLLMVHPAASRSPTLSKDAHIENLVRMGRRASQSIRAVTESYNAVITSGHADRDQVALWERRCSSSSMESLGTGRLGEAFTCVVLDKPSGRMDPKCSMQVFPRQQGDVDPSPVLGSLAPPGWQGAPPRACRDAPLKDLNLAAGGPAGFGASRGPRVRGPQPGRLQPPSPLWHAPAATPRLASD
mmetsp:Transcript_5922/g.17692  ORF Transcript_5922/g.17692 Transcript_5922/m.17692 type:complete len:489 (-) Transcript_5922:60-1526(-)